MNKRASLEDAIHHAKNRVFEKIKNLINNDPSPEVWSNKDPQTKKTIANSLIELSSLLKLPDDQIITLHQLKVFEFWFGNEDDFWETHIRNEVWEV